MPVTIGMPVHSGRSARLARQSIEEGGGIKICCCRVFTCVNLNFLLTNHGLLKVSEVILGSCCQTLLVRFGMKSAAEIGQAFETCLTTVSSCLMVSTLLLICYVVSTRTFNLVRQSLFVSFIFLQHQFPFPAFVCQNKNLVFVCQQEILYNLLACFMYLSASVFMGFTVSWWLYPKFEMHQAYASYPAMTAVYVSICAKWLSFSILFIVFVLFYLQYIGLILGIIHGIDAALAYKFYKGYL